MRHNPFAGVGHPVHGAEHVGRGRDIRALTERVLTHTTAGAAAIIGPPRIGKSSLAHHLFMSEEARRAHPTLLPVWINTRLVDGIHGLFVRLVEKVWDLLHTYDIEVDRRLSRDYECAVADDVAWFQVRLYSANFLASVRERGVRVVLILDEFDSAREVLSTQPGAFQALRELSYNLETNIGLVTTSRRELRHIVDYADPDESTFPGIFSMFYLTCFDEPDLTALARRLDTDHGAALVPRLMDMSGGHPFLASHLLNRVWNETSGATPISMQAAIPALREPMPAEFQHYYHDLQRLLDTDGRLQALLEIVLGPQLTVTPEDAQNLLQQGIIRESGEGYTTFSAHFLRFLTLLSRELNPWETWNTVENGMRDLIERTFENRYGIEWAAECRRRSPQTVAIFDHCERTRKQEVKSFGSRASARLIDYTNPNDLFRLMASHWTLFSPIMGKNPAYWEERFDLLRKVRNPMAHSRAHGVDPTDRKMFDAYCAELLDIVKS